MIRKGLLSSIFILLGGPLMAQTFFEEDFNNGQPPSWSIIDEGNSNATWEHKADHNGNNFDGTPLMVVSSNDAGASDTLVEKLESPAASAGSADNLFLTFDHFFSNNGPERGYVDVWDGNTWQQVASYSSSLGSWNNPNSPDIDLTPHRNNNLKVRFRYEDNGAWGYFWAVDNVKLWNKECFDPTNLEVVQVNANSAYVTWDSQQPSANWQVRFGPSGFAPGNGDTITSSNDTAAIGPLNPDTEYDFYVRELCVNGNVSNWVGPGTFSTRCNTKILAYEEDMESFQVNYDATGYSCWVPMPGNTSGEYRWNTNSGNTSSSSTGPDADHTLGTNSGIYAYTESTSGSAGDEANLSSSRLDLFNTQHPIMTFWYHMYGSSMGELHVDVSTDNGQTWDLDVMPPIIGEQQSSMGAAWEQQYVDLSSYSGEVIIVRFRGVRGSSFRSDMAIDDIKVQEASPRDLKVKSFISPTEPECYSSNHPVELPVVNGGLDTIDLNQTNVDVTVEVSGLLNTTLTTTVTNNSLNGGQPMGTLDTIVVPMGNINMSNNGIYEFKGYISAINGDTVRVNDTTTQEIIVQSPSGGTVSGGGVYCKGDTASLEVSGQTGPVQWQMDEGMGWTNVAATGDDSTSINMLPNSDTTYFRVDVCGAAQSNVDTVIVNEVTPPTAINDTFCKGIDGSAQLGAQGGGNFFWYDTDSSQQIADTGQSTTVDVQYIDRTMWVARADSSVADPVLITEIDHGSNDGVEIQNVSASTVDVSGWTVALNDHTSIDTWNDVADERWDLSGTMSSGAIKVGDENGGDLNMGWTSSDEGWVMLLDDNNNVVDWAPFGWTQSEVQNFNATILGNTISGSNHWNGPAITSCGFGENLQRTGDSDNDDETDWICNSNKTMGSTNPGLDLPFGGCQSERVPVTAYAEDCTGMESFKDELSFSLYPNPVDEHFFIRMTGGEAIEGRLSLMDLKGRMIRSEESTLRNGKNRFETDGLADGVYMISFRSEQGTFTKKLVVR